MIRLMTTLAVLIALPASADPQEALSVLRACLAEAWGTGSADFDAALAACGDEADAAADADFAARRVTHHDQDQLDAMRAAWLRERRPELEAGF